MVPISDTPRVAVIGLGYVGTCLAVALAGNGLDVVALERQPRIVEELKRGVCRLQETGLEEELSRVLREGRLTVTTEWSAISDADVVLITVGTPMKSNGSLAHEQLLETCKSLSEHARPGQLIVVKSTVPPGTTRDLVLPVLESRGLRGGEDFALVYSPERLAEGNALQEIRSLPIVVGGLREQCAESAAEFWRTGLGVEVIRQSSLESAEIVKLADNWWIDLNISLANELAKYCSVFGADALEVIHAANSIPKGNGNVNILLPSVGVGGSCLTKDPWMVWNSAQARGLDIRTVPAARAVNDSMPEYTASRILEELAQLGKGPGSAKVAVLGLAFKNDTGDLRATPVLGTVEALRKAGVDIRLYDPLVDPGEAEALFGIAPEKDLESAARDADCLAILALHRKYEEIDFAGLPVADSCLVFDARAYYPKAENERLQRLGYVYCGIGW